MVLLLSFMPNSPRFLLSRGREEEALRALTWLRHTTDTQDVRWEFEQIQNNVQRQVRLGRACLSESGCFPWGKSRTEQGYPSGRPGARGRIGQQIPLSGGLVFQSSRVSWAEIREPHMHRPILIALLMRFLQQLTGITPILVYLQPIFDSTAVLLVRAHLGPWGSRTEPRPWCPPWALGSQRVCESSGDHA